MSDDSIERDGIKWGDCIPVDGKRPEWVRDQDIIRAWTKGGNEWNPYRTAVMNVWPNTGFIALYADHPYYAQKKREIDPALVERMVALVRRVASDEPGGRDRYRTDAKALIAEMVPASVQRFQCDNPLWHLMDRAELIERVLAWKETNA